MMRRTDHIDLLHNAVCKTILCIIPFAQLVPVLLISLVLALHIFARPYEKMRNNIIEAVILVNYTLLFLFRGTQTILDNLSTYTGNQVNNVCQCECVYIYYMQVGRRKSTYS